MNGKIERFEDLEVWKESMRLATGVYKNLKKTTDYRLRDQLQRSAVSIPSNIAEGYERKSNKEFIQFLYIAKASCGELRTQLYLAQQTKIIDKVTCDELLELSKKISAMLFKFIKTRKEKF